MAKNNAGRPAGTHNSTQAIVAVIPAACPKCLSTEREAIRIIRERNLPGKTPTGQPMTHILWRRVRCKDCGQYFTEMEYQNRPSEKKRIENLDSCLDSPIERDRIECLNEPHD